MASLKWRHWLGERRRLPGGRTAAGRPAARGRTPAAKPAVTKPVVTAAAPAASDTEERSGRRRRGRGRGRGKGAAVESGESVTPATPSRPVLAQGGLTLAEAFHLVSRALGELPVPTPGETLRARMAVLHGKEDPLLDTARFAMLLRQANDAEVADVRMIGEDQYEVAPHKTDLAMQKQVRAAAAAAPATDDAPATPAAPRQPPALRFRGGSRTATRRPEIPMFGVVELESGDTAKIAAAPAPEAVAEPNAADVVSAAPAEKKVKASRPGRRVPKAKAADASVAEVTKPATAPKVAKKAPPKRARKKASAKSAKPTVG